MSRAVCRACLAGTSIEDDDVKVIVIEDQLLEIYEKLTSAPLSPGDWKHNTLCYICYSQLRKCLRFSDMASRSERYLKDVLKSDNKTNEVACVQRPRLQTLSMMTLKSHSLDGLSKSSTPLENALLLVKNEPENETTTVTWFEVNNIDELINKKTNMKETNSKKEMFQSGSSDGVPVDELVEALEMSCEDSTADVDPGDSVVKEYLVLNDRELCYECDICNDVFPTKKEQSVHKKSCIKGEIESISNLETWCQVCKKIFVGSKAKFIAHMRHHNKDKRFTCNECGTGCSTLDSFKRHLRIHTGEKVYCKICNKGYAQLSSLGKHMHTHKDEQPYACQYCGKTFKHKDNIRSHIRFIHEGNRPHSCEVCGQKFTMKSHWRHHMNRHSGTRDYSCDNCDKKFYTNYAKTKHMKSCL